MEWSVSLSSIDWIWFSFFIFYCFILNRDDCLLMLCDVNPPEMFCWWRFVSEVFWTMPKLGLQVIGMFMCLFLMELNISYFEPYEFNLFSSFLCFYSSPMAIDGTLYMFLFTIFPSYKIFSNSILSVIRYLPLENGICYMLFMGFNFLWMNASDLMDFSSLFMSFRES